MPNREADANGQNASATSADFCETLPPPGQSVIVTGEQTIKAVGFEVEHCLYKYNQLKLCLILKSYLYFAIYLFSSAGIML
jgi:hypothetical protein